MTIASAVSRCALALGSACILYSCSAEPASQPMASGPARTPNGSRVLVPSHAASEPACAAISQQARNQRASVDIIIAVDNSGSMSEEIAFVRDQLNVFSERVAESGVDVHIILISAPYTPPAAKRDDDDDDDESDEGEDNGLCIAPPLGSGSCPSDSRGMRFLHVAQEVRSHDALALIIETFPAWQARLRAESNKVFVVVSDDAADESPQWFEQRIAALPGGLFPSWSFSGIFCFSKCPEAAAIGVGYSELVRRTGCVAGDLCQQDFGPVFEALAHAIVASSALACSWDIPAPPAGLAFDRDRVNVQYRGANTAPTQLLQTTSSADCGPTGGWHYDDEAAPQRILACPVSCAALQSDPGAEVDVLFGCDSQLAPD
jgi:hypothetical protein